MDSAAENYRRFLEGEKEAFDKIMEELFHSLVFFINRYVHDMHTAEDLAIDVFSELLVHKHRYHFRVKLKTYLFMLGRSRALDWLKHQKVLSFVELTEAEGIPENQSAPEESFLADEQKRALHAALSSLPQEMQTAVHLVYFEDMSYEEAAAVMRKNKKQIDNLLYRAKKELRELLIKEGQP